MVSSLRRCIPLQFFQCPRKFGYSKKDDDKSINNKNDRTEKPKEEDPKKIAEYILMDYPCLPEEPTTCCMTGCANCVWLEYADKLSDYFKDGGDKAVQAINEHVNDSNIKAYLLMEIKLKERFKT